MSQRHPIQRFILSYIIDIYSVTCFYKKSSLSP